MLRKLYPDFAAQVVATALGRGIKSVYSKANELGLKKSAEFFSTDASGRVARGKQHPAMVASQFKNGMAPWNAGKKGWQAGGRSHETRFKPGRPATEARNYAPIGSLRISKDGYLERKVNDTHPVHTRRWVAVHRLVWEAANGPITNGWIVVFKGARTTVEAEITADKLECISRAEHVRRNHPRTKHPELGRLVQLKGAITRQVNRIAREHADRNSTQPQTGATT